MASNTTEAADPLSWVEKILSPDQISITTQLVSSSMGIIWLGAHASLRRPPSAALAKGKTREDEENNKFTEGMVASDAIMFPLLAGTVLIGLYYLIQWLQDPDILNKLITGYMSIMSLVSLGKFTADALHVVTNFVFPQVWRDKDGKTIQIDPANRCQRLLDAKEKSTPWTNLNETPFPGHGKSRLSEKTIDLAWKLRHLFTEEWTIRLAMHGVGSLKTGIKLNDMIGVFFALAVNISYYVTGSHWLSNIQASALCYSVFSLLSPTSFPIGSLVLAGLFVYDIVMVFYTPYMIAVATKLDAPIKLVFKTASGRSSLLGLGDIVIPGIFISQALRFDLWRFYEKKIQYIPTELEAELADPVSKKAQVIKQTQHRAVKQPFIDPQGQWGDRFWTTNFRRPFATPTATKALAATAFPKTYFYASMAGYAAGILATILIMVIFDHGQPALLYLVPGVVGSTWLTGAIRGELRDMWTYTEDGSLDTEDVVVELDGEGNVIKSIRPDEEEEKQLTKKDGSATGTQSSSKQDSTPSTLKAGLLVSGEDKASLTAETAHDKDKDYEVFLFSITAPSYHTLSSS